MAFSRLLHSAFFRTAVLAAGTSLLTYAAIRGSYAAAVTGVLLVMTFAALQVKSVRDMKERCGLLVEAIRNNDFTFRLPTNYLSYNEKILQDTLNSFGQLMGEQKMSREQSEHFYGQILANVTTGIVVLDSDGRIIQTNAAAARLFDIPVLSTLQQLQKFDAKLPDALRNMSGGEHLLVDITTTRGHARLSMTAVSTVLNDSMQRIIAINDIRAEMDEKEVDTWIKLTRVLTHEIMNSVAPIVSISDTFMHRDDVLGTSLYKGIQAIHDTSEGLVNFVDSYRKFSSLQKPQPATFELLPLLHQVAEIVQLPPNIKLLLDIDPKDTMLFADKGLIRQVLINLLKNAVEAIGTTDGGRIMLRSYIAANEHVFLSICNNGPSIARDEAEQIFIPFYTTKKSGNGIGLSLSRQIMKLTGGSITLLPAGSGGWNTTFVLEFV